MRASIHRFLPAATPGQAFWRAYFDELIPRFTRQELLNRIRVMIDLERHPANATAWQGPVLIVDAAEDRLIPQRAQAALHALYPQAHRVTIQGAGHAAALECTEQYIALYRAFLQGIDGKRHGQ